MPLLSDAVSSIYTGARELDFKNMKCAILDYTPADNRLSDEQVAEIQDDVAFLRSSFMSVENLSMEVFGAEGYQRESRHQIIPAANLSSYRLSRCPTPDTTDSSNETLSRVSSYFTAQTSPSLKDESEDVPTGRIYTSSIDEADEGSRKARSRQPFRSVQTSTSSPIELPGPSEEIPSKPKLQRTSLHPNGPHHFHPNWNFSWRNYYQFLGLFL
jgi:hypothetical protein